MKLSAGLLVYRLKPKLEVLLVHPGGPFWARKDAWGIPKGEYEETLDSLEAAKREFEEEVGQPPPLGEFIKLGEIKRRDGKLIKAWGVEGDMDVSNITSNTIFIDWPPRSGKKMEVPEVDKAQWIPAALAITKVHKGQDVFIQRLVEHLDYELDKPEPEQSSLF